MSFTSSFASKIKQTRAEDILLIKGFSEGDDCWHYVHVDNSKAVILDKLIGSGQQIDYSNYGRVLISGWGKNPPNRVDEIIKDQGVNFYIDESEAEQSTYFIRNQDDNGREFYNFVGVPKFLVDEFKYKCTVGQFDLLDYGYIMKSGWGRLTEEDLQFMEKEHNYNRELIKEYLAEA